MLGVRKRSSWSSDGRSSLTDTRTASGHGAAAAGGRVEVLGGQQAGASAVRTVTKSPPSRRVPRPTRHRSSRSVPAPFLLRCRRRKRLNLVLVCLQNGAGGPPTRDYSSMPLLAAPAQPGQRIAFKVRSVLQRHKHLTAEGLRLDLETSQTKV